MAFSVNLAVITGNVTNAPVVKYTPAGNAVCNFNVATNRSVKNGDNYEDVPTFHRVVVWGKIAEWLGNNLRKGDPVNVTGRIDNRSYEQDGVTKYISEIVADTVIPFARKAKGETTAAKPASGQDEYQAATEVFGGTPAKKAAPAKPVEPAAPTQAELANPGTDEVNIEDIPF